MLDKMIVRLKELTGLSRPAPFEKQNFAAREIYRGDYQVLARSVLTHIRFDSVMDIGCANGFLLSEFNNAGKKFKGIELSPHVIEFLPAELRRAVQIGDFSEAQGSYDLVSCVEVAEHIQPSMSERLVKKLAELALDKIYFTAAPPGQPGHGHINCRPHQEWLDMFGELGWSCDWDLTEKIRRDLEQLRYAVWLRGNSFVLSRCPSRVVTN